MKEIEVDQSGKIEDLEVDTVLAFSNHSRCAIRIPAKVKRIGLEYLRYRNLSRRIRTIRMLAAGLFLLLKDDIHHLNYITIDVEFAGREADLKNMLLILIWRKQPLFSNDRINFMRVGKKSPAHHLALSTYRGFTPANRTITEAEFLAVLK